MRSSAAKRQRNVGEMSWNFIVPEEWSGVSLAGFLGNSGADPNGLAGGEELGPPEEGYGEGGTPLRRKKCFFCLKWHALVNSERYFF